MHRPMLASILLAFGLILFGRFIPALGGESPQIDPPTIERARDAIRRSLPFVEREGVAWMEKRKCMSCHQVPTLVWTFNEAQRRGFEIDADKLKGWNEWSFKSALGGKPYYRLPDSAFEPLQQAGLSEDELAKLKTIKNQDFVTERAFLDEVKTRLSPADMTEHTAAVLKGATKPGMSPGSDSGPSAAYQILLHTGTPAATAAPQNAVAALLEGLVRTQQKDGIWKTSSQFHGMNRPQPESNEVNTMWILLALSYQDKLSPTLVECRQRAEAAFQKFQPGVSTESLLLHVLMADLHQETAQSETLLKQLLALQRDDGGWAWRKENTDSDPLTTGEVLYGLGQLGRTLQEPQVGKAWSYLLKNQQEDGSWNAPWLTFNVENKKDHTDGNKVFSFWGTTWSLLGLMHTMPQ